MRAAFKVVTVVILALLCSILERTVASAGATSPIRVQCIGDSTTVGYTDNPTWDVEFDFGYRLGLYKRLTAANYSIQFVGDSPQPWFGFFGLPQTIGSPDLRDLDQDHHRGYAGYTIDIVRDYIVDWVKADEPDLILLMIGKMDFPYGWNPELVPVMTCWSNLVETIVTVRPEAHVIVGQIPPFVMFVHPSLTDFNTYLRDELVPGFANRGKRVTGSDLYSPILRPSARVDDIDSSLFADNWAHFTPEGNDRLAQTWFKAIVALYPQGPPEIVSGPTWSPRGEFKATFAGLAHECYRIDRAPRLDGPWEIGFTNLTARADGRFELDDLDSGGTTARFYRIGPQCGEP